MTNRWLRDSAPNAVGPGCDKLVTSRLEYRTVTLGPTRLRVERVLVDVCPECDATIRIPRKSLAQPHEVGRAP